MWTATGNPASSALAQKASSTSLGYREPLGKEEMTAPRWPFFMAKSSSARASSTPVVGMMAWEISRPPDPSQKLRIHSL